MINIHLPVRRISLVGTINPLPPVGGNSIQYAYRIPRVPVAQS